MADQNIYEAVETTEAVKEEVQFSVLDSVYAWITLILGYLFCRAFPVKESTLGGFLLILSAFVITFIVFNHQCAINNFTNVITITSISSSTWSISITVRTSKINRSRFC